MYLLTTDGHYKRVRVLCKTKEIAHRSPDKRRRGQEGAESAKKRKKKNLATDFH
jgi:hypothetical protein